MRVVHTAIWVSDLDETSKFFIDHLGLDHVKDFVGGDGVTNFYVAGDGGASIQLKYDPDGDYDVEPSGIDHLSLAVDDTDGLVERLQSETDCSVVKGPKTVNDSVSDKRIAFVEIPDGYVLELEQTLE
ncbi:VOC family protein [Halogeometricum limi]|uniref:Lactoylglutathione lyase n=1 Tax=Halogeometricum limi TaxID=555875 RepID=A0A1I6IC02_9EURY|nr:VOC family protein [Halogeometricum limi]SFR64287.1 lactoylglutathione lyase [Halogeometricum limi]